ncbi:siderophore-interacting protein [soil metagenome]
MPTILTVTRAETLTPTLRRLWFHTDDLSAFADSTDTDRYVKLVFPRDGQELPDDVDLRELRRTKPPEEQPIVRTYTALFPDLAAGSLAIDFVIHGDDGVAGPWARAAEPGDRLLANGPGGGYAPDPTVDWHLLAGDESAVPAITAALAVLPEEAVARVVILVDSPDHEPELATAAQVDVSFVHRSTGDDLERAVRRLAWLPGRVQAFVHGEAGVVMHAVRPYLVDERGVARGDLSISGYWRQGRSEEGFRDWKAEQARGASVDR